MLLGYLQFAARGAESRLLVFDGTLLHAVLPERMLQEHVAALLDELVGADLIRAWAFLQPSHRAFLNGNPHGQHRACVLVSAGQLLALLQDERRGARPDAPPAPA